MKHKETIRILPEANTAVMLIHGICGSPNHFRQLLPIESQIPKDWSVYNLVLDGHCKTVKDFGKSSMKKWKAQVQAVFDVLCKTHEKVVLVGHSMGTLFSIQLAIQRPEKVAFLFLLAVPVRVAVQPKAVRYLLRIAFDRVDEQDPVLVSMHNGCGITQTKKLWKYVPWAPRMVELLRECGMTRKSLAQLRAPCIAWQSDKDEMVSGRAGKLLHKSGRVEVHHLQNSTHFYYPHEETEVILESFRATCATYQ